MFTDSVIDYINLFLTQKGFVLKEKGDKTAKLFEYGIYKNEIYFGIVFLPLIYKNKHFWGFTFINKISIIEEIAAKILFDMQIIAVKADEISYSIHFEYNGNYVLPTGGILIDSEQKVDKVCRLFDKFYDEYFSPFYERWDSLYTLYEYIKNKEGREELDPILGQFWQFKKATILRLCNDENYQDYMDAFYNREKQYFDEDPEDIDNIRYYNAAKQLKEVLDKTAPIYNV